MLENVLVIFFTDVRDKPSKLLVYDFKMDFKHPETSEQSCYITKSDNSSQISLATDVKCKLMHFTTDESAVVLKVSRRDNSSKNSLTPDVKSKLMQRLESLTTEPSDLHIRRFLESIFDFCRTTCTLSDEEKKLIGKGIKENLMKILAFLASYAYDIEPEKILCTLVYRSAIQFIIDNFQEFPTDDSGDVKLNMYLDQIKTHYHAVAYLDKQNQYWVKSRRSGHDFFSFYRKDPPRPANVPSSHSWWC